MERYAAYKDSGVEWIGEIPDGWEVKQIKRLSIVRRGASPRPIADPKYFDNEGEYAWVRIADVSASERYLENSTQTLSELGSSLSIKMQPDNIFLSIAGTVGKPIITKIKCCIHDGFVYFPNLKINPEYLYFIFSTGLPYQGLGKWGTQLNLNTDTVGEITIPLPTTNEITAIVSYLDRKTAEIDALIAQKQRLIELYQEEKTAIINQAVTQGINPNAEFKDSGINWLGEIPVGWEVKKLKYLADARPSNIDKKSKDEEGAVLLCNYVDVYKNEFISSELVFMMATASQEQKEKFLLQKGDVLVTKDSETPNDIAIPALVIEDFDNVVCGYHLTHIKPKKIIGSYLFRYFQTKYLSSYFEVSANGVTRYGLGVDKFGSALILNPPTEEQTAIFHHIEIETSRIDAKIAKTQCIVELQKEYRTALISEVVTGKIKVSHPAGKEITL